MDKMMMKVMDKMMMKVMDKMVMIVRKIFLTLTKGSVRSVPMS